MNQWNLFAEFKTYKKLKSIVNDVDLSLSAVGLDTKTELSRKKE